MKMKIKEPPFVFFIKDFNNYDDIIFYVDTLINSLKYIGFYRQDINLVTSQKNIDILTEANPMLKNNEVPTVFGINIYSVQKYNALKSELSPHDYEYIKFWR